MFVNEYRNLLADRLIQSLNYDISREVCVLISFHLHLAALTYCMLKISIIFVPRYNVMCDNLLNVVENVRL